MKKFLLVASLSFSLMACATTSQSTDSPLGNLLGGLSGASGTQTSSQQSSGSGLGSVLGGIVSGLLSNDKVSAESMVGTWKYASPAVCFQSENLLQKAGGAAMATQLENKLAPYYKTAGITKLVLTIEQDKSFTMQVGKVPLTGTIETDGKGQVYFNFAALNNSVALGKMKAYVNMTAGTQMSLMFDVSKLVDIVSKVGSVAGNSTINGVTSLLTSYDGVCAGFKLNKQ